MKKNPSFTYKVIELAAKNCCFEEKNMKKRPNLNKKGVLCNCVILTIVAGLSFYFSSSDTQIGSICGRIRHLSTVLVAKFVQLGSS